MIDSLRSEIVLSVNRALIGEVFPELVAVSCHVVTDKRFTLTFFVESGPSSQMVEDISCIETEIIADFPSEFDITHEIKLATHMKRELDGFWIFLRRLNE